MVRGKENVCKNQTSKTAISNFLKITNSPVLFIKFCFCHTCVTITSYHLSSCFLQHLCQWIFYA